MNTRKLSFNQFKKESANLSLYLLCGSVYVAVKKTAINKAEKGMRAQQLKGCYTVQTAPHNPAIMLIESITH